MHFCGIIKTNKCSTMWVVTIWIIIAIKIAVEIRNFIAIRITVAIGEFIAIEISITIAIR